MDEGYANQKKPAHVLASVVQEVQLEVLELRALIGRVSEAIAGRVVNSELFNIEFRAMQYTVVAPLLPSFTPSQPSHLSCRLVVIVQINAACVDDVGNPVSDKAVKVLRHFLATYEHIVSDRRALLAGNGKLLGLELRRAARSGEER